LAENNEASSAFESEKKLAYRTLLVDVPFHQQAVAPPAARPDLHPPLPKCSYSIINTMLHTTPSLSTILLLELLDVNMGFATLWTILLKFLQQLLNVLS
tara:strand:+ start:961 stop:1257 length:297 start_codon:yes stop_codon:yes gene_type:complete